MFAVLSNITANKEIQSVMNYMKSEHDDIPLCDKRQKVEDVPLSRGKFDRRLVKQLDQFADLIQNYMLKYTHLLETVILRLTCIPAHHGYILCAQHLCRARATPMMV